MVDWQVTATTIYCDAVADEVTIIVYSDWSTTCTGIEKYAVSREGSIKLVKRSLALRVPLDCQQADCTHIPEYVEKLKTEERRRSRTKD